MNRILVLENDPYLNGLICDCLNNSGFQVDGYLHSDDGLKAICDRHYELIVAGIAPSDSDVFRFARTIRTFGNDTPILFMSDRGVLLDKNIAFRLGTDEYLEKPVVLEEFLMRIRAILRRSDGEVRQKICVGKLELDPDYFSASVDGKVILLSAIEFHILYKLLSNPRKVLSRAHLVAEVWGTDSAANVRLVDTYICKLRSKFSQFHDFRIVSVRARGYMAVPTTNH